MECRIDDIPKMPNWLELTRPFEKIEYGKSTKKKAAGSKQYIKTRPSGPTHTWPCKIAGCKNKRLVKASGRVESMCKMHFNEYYSKKAQKSRKD